MSKEYQFPADNRDGLDWLDPELDDSDIHQTVLPIVMPHQGLTGLQALTARTEELISTNDLTLLGLDLPLLQASTSTQLQEHSQNPFLSHGSEPDWSVLSGADFGTPNVRDFRYPYLPPSYFAASNEQTYIHQYRTAPLDTRSSVYSSQIAPSDTQSSVYSSQIGDMSHTMPPPMDSSEKFANQELPSRSQSVKSAPQSRRQPGMSVAGPKAKSTAGRANTKKPYARKTGLDGAINFTPERKKGEEIARKELLVALAHSGYWMYPDPKSTETYLRPIPDYARKLEVDIDRVYLTNIHMPFGSTIQDSEYNSSRSNIRGVVKSINTHLVTWIQHNFTKFFGEMDVNQLVTLQEKILEFVLIPWEGDWPPFWITEGINETPPGHCLVLIAAYKAIKAFLWQEELLQGLEYTAHIYIVMDHIIHSFNSAVVYHADCLIAKKQGTKPPTFGSAYFRYYNASEINLAHFRQSSPAVPQLSFDFCIFWAHDAFHDNEKKKKDVEGKGKAVEK